MNQSSQINTIFIYKLYLQKNLTSKCIDSKEKKFLISCEKKPLLTNINLTYVEIYP